MIGKEKEFDFKTTFPPLGNPEHHFNKYPNHPWLRTKEEIESWILNNVGEYSSKKEDVNTNYIINDDLTVSFKSYMVIKNITNYIPIQIRKCSYFYASEIKLMSLIGSPISCIYVVADNNEIKNLEGLSKFVHNGINLNSNNIENFEFMHQLDAGNKMYLLRNPIKSWSGFTNVGNLKLFDEEEESDELLEFIYQTPKEVFEIEVGINFENNKIQLIRNSEGIELKSIVVDMEWLRNEQEKKEVFNLKQKMGDNLLVNKKNNKRKL